MKRILAAFPTVICILSLLTFRARAQDPPAASAVNSFPIIPISLDFRLIPRFFRQPLTDDSKYSSIDAFVDDDQKNPWHEVVLREKASGTQVYYCNSQSTVASLTERGEEAYYAHIDFQSSQDATSKSAFELRVNDSSHQPIEWHFVIGAVDNGKNGTPGFMARPDDSGFVLLYKNRQFISGPGTVLSVGGRQYPAGENAFYSPDVLMAKLQAITEEWTVASAPAQVRPGSEWMVRNKAGADGQLTVQSISGDHAVLEMKTRDSHDSAIQFDVQRARDQFRLVSVTATAQGHIIRISFNPSLPLPVAIGNDKSEAMFTMDEDKKIGVAAGRVVSIRGMGDEHFHWEFRSPDWAKAKQLDTGVNVLLISDSKEMKKVPVTGMKP